MIVPAKLFDGALWVKATEHQRAITEAEKQQAVSAAWQGLTDEEIDAALFPFDRDSSFIDIARAIEAHLKEKNT